MSDSILAQREVTLLEVLERVLDKGVVIAGDLTISVAGVDLIYLGLRALLCSVETIKRPVATASRVRSSTATHPSAECLFHPVLRTQHSAPSTL